ncbi:hypothetical protein TURU_030547 [Turdus rufiventris]|nr:hypothetical protein TURU_030547 [Turdus rufiventris]
MVGARVGAEELEEPDLGSDNDSALVLILFRDTDGRMLLDIFDENLHPLSKSEVPPDYDKHDPEQKQIYRFVRTLFSAAQLTAECAIVTLVYLERLLTYAEIDICPANWKRIVLGAILLASKVWDDQAVWNVDYCQILKDITVEDMNELERQFLELLQFNINVPSSVYAKYYFDLRSLAEANNLSFPLEPLSRDRAYKLEAISRLCEDKYKDFRKAAKKRSGCQKIQYLSVNLKNVFCLQGPFQIPFYDYSQESQARVYLLPGLDHWALLLKKKQQDGKLKKGSRDFHLLHLEIFGEDTLNKLLGVVKCGCIPLPGQRIHTEVGAIGSDKLELLEDNVLKAEEDQHSKLTVLFKSSK